MNVIKLRRQHRVDIGDGGVKVLQFAIGAQANATQYLPIALILLLCLEYSSGSAWLIHTLGLALITGRVIHVPGLLRQKLRLRVLGMQITIYTILGLAILNIVYFLRSLLSAWPFSSQ